MARISVTFEPGGRRVEVDAPDAPFGGLGKPGSLLDIASGNGVEIGSNCGGNGICGMCCVVVENGAENLSGADDDERATLEAMTDNGPNHRLACQAVVSGDVTVRVVG